jgi:hypothetical protein
MLLHKHHHSSALVRLAANPWTASAAQPTARAALAAALQSLHRRVRGVAYDRRAPSASVLDLLPASGLRVSHVAALHLSADDSDVHADDWFAPLRVAAPVHVPGAFSAAQLVTVVYQTVGVLPSSIPVDPCVLVPAALVGRAGPCMSASERDADGRLLFDRVLFDRPIGVAVRAGALSAKLANNPLFRSQRTSAPPPPPPMRSAAAAADPTPVPVPQPMIRRQASTDSNSRDVALADSKSPFKSPLPPPPPPPPAASKAAAAPILSSIDLHTPTPIEPSISEPIQSESEVQSSSFDASLTNSVPVVMQAVEEEEEREPGAQEPISVSASHDDERSPSHPLQSRSLYQQNSVQLIPLQLSSSPDSDIGTAAVESQSMPVSPPPPHAPPPPPPPLPPGYKAKRAPSMFGTELAAVIQRRTSVVEPVDAQPMNTAVADSSHAAEARPSRVESDIDIGPDQMPRSAGAALVAATPLPPAENQRSSNVHVASSPPLQPPPPPPPLKRAVSLGQHSGVPPPPPPPPSRP